MRWINLNGQLQDAEAPALRADSRAFRHGYALFETMLWQERGGIRLEALHRARLASALDALLLALPAHGGVDHLFSEIDRTIRKNRLAGQGRVRLQVSGGHGGLYEDAFTPEFLIECWPLAEAQLSLNENGLVIGLAEGLYKEPAPFSRYKTANGLVYVLAARQARDRRWNDILVPDAAGRILESSIGNIFWLKDNVWHTPPLSSGCVGGVMREFLIGRAVPGFSFQETDTMLEDLMSAEELFISNAVRGMRWVRAFGEKEYGFGGTRRLWEACFGSTHGG